MNKLQVGQRIGIYEVIKNDVGRSPVFPIGYQSIGYVEKTAYKEVQLRTIRGTEFNYLPSEVRKVGTLIVKKVK